MGSLFGGGGSRQLYATTLASQQGAQQQAAANKEAAIAGAKMSMIDQYSPYGSMRYSSLGRDTDGTERFRLDQTFDPVTQQTLDAQKQADLKTNQLGGQQIDRASGILGQNADFSEGAIQQRIAAMNDPRLNETFDRERQKLTENMMNRGVREGTQAWRDAFTEFDRRENDARTQSALQSRGQALTEIPMARTQALNEIAALMGTGQIQQPNYVNTPQTRINPADYQGAAAQQIAALNQYQQGKQAAAGGIAGLIGQGIGTAASMFMRSDRRVKTDIRQVGSLANGLPLYVFRYIGGGPMQLGLMAQDVEKVAPHAVAEFGGIKHVNYDAAVNWRAE